MPYDNNQLLRNPRPSGSTSIQHPPTKPPQPETPVDTTPRFRHPPDRKHRPQYRRWMLQITLFCKKNAVTQTPDFILGTWFIGDLGCVADENGILVMQAEVRAIQFPSSITRPQTNQIHRLWYSCPDANSIQFKGRPDGDEPVGEGFGSGLDTRVNVGREARRTGWN